jgi:hypothetical protein
VDDLDIELVIEALDAPEPPVPSLEELVAQVDRAEYERVMQEIRVE